eukprot:349898-Chlamydomonas_euryale.AAC.5
MFVTAEQEGRFDATLNNKAQHVAAWRMLPGIALQRPLGHLSASLSLSPVTLLQSASRLSLPDPTTLVAGSKGVIVACAWRSLVKLAIQRKETDLLEHALVKPPAQ